MFGKEQVNEVDLKEKFKELFSNKSEHIIVLYDVVYHHIISKDMYMYQCINVLM